MKMRGGAGGTKNVKIATKKWALVQKVELQKVELHKVERLKGRIFQFLTSKKIFRFFAGKSAKLF